MKTFETGTHAQPNTKVYEGPFPDSITETAGYMTAQQQIERLIASGQILEHWKKAHFPPDTDIPDNFLPPDYCPNEMDLIDEARLVVAGKTKAAARLALWEKENPPEEETPPTPPIEDPPTDDSLDAA